MSNRFLHSSEHRVLCVPLAGLSYGLRNLFHLEANHILFRAPPPDERMRSIPLRCRIIASPMQSHLTSLGVSSAAATRPTHDHPYEYEIQHFEYLSEQLVSCQERLYRPLKEVTFFDDKTSECIRTFRSEICALQKSLTEHCLHLLELDLVSFVTNSQ